MNGNLIVEMYHGSHLYGTASATSDVDIKGIATAAPRDVLLGTIPKIVAENHPAKAEGQKNSAGDIDRTIFSLHHFIHLALKGETVAIDMLHAPASAIINDGGPCWDLLVRNRHRFYTKRMTALVGYARHQAAKYGLKGSRLAAAKMVLGWADNFSATRPIVLRDCMEDLPSGEHLHKLPASAEHNGLAMYEVCGMKFQETCALSYVCTRLQEFVDRFGARAKAAESNQGVDWKAIHHAFRAAYQMRAILRDGGFTYPLVETPRLLQVKRGLLPYTEAGPELEELIDEVEALAAQSNLPDAPDTVWAHDVLAAFTRATL